MPPAPGLYTCKYFVKGSRILYTFALLNMGWQGQTAVLEHFKMVSIIICIFFTLKDWTVCSVNLGSVGFQDSD